MSNIINLKIMKKALLILGLLLVPTFTFASTLSVSPSTQNVSVGSTFTVNVNLDTQNTSIDGVDLRYLNYNPSLLQVEDANVSTSGIQIAPGNLMAMTLVNKVDQSLGRITFSQVTGGNTKYRGSGTLATITFRALAAGTANLTFNYTANNTTDTNVAANGSDSLTAVVNGSYTIGGGSSSSNTTTNTGAGNLSFSGGGGGGGGVGNIASNAYCAPGQTVATLNTNFGMGTRGTNVTALQNFLVQKGFLTADNATGFFGALTQAALQKFQAANGIVSSGSPDTTGYGFAGPTTRARINSMLSGGVSNCVGQVPTGVQVAVSNILSRNLSYGAQGDDVKSLQNFLVSRGHLTADSTTGFFGALTQAAVKAFQAANGIVSSGSPETTGYGNVGPSTRSKINALLGSSAGSAPSTQNSQALQAQVEALQKQVNELLLKLQKAQ